MLSMRPLYFMRNSNKIANRILQSRINVIPCSGMRTTTTTSTLTSSPRTVFLSNRSTVINPKPLPRINDPIVHHYHYRPLSTFPMKKLAQNNSFMKSNQLPFQSPFHSNLGSLHHLTSLPNNNNLPPPKNRRGMFGMLGASALILASKGKYLLGALKLTKFASLGSMFVTIGTYSMFFGLPYAVGMVSLIVIHESGHALTMKKLGIPYSPMIFIPFVGASVAMNKMPRDAYEEALIAFGGPVLGSLGALGVAGAAHLTQSQLLYALGDFGFMINLFNLLPIGFMDGGRICGALSPYSGVIGLGMGGGLIYLDVIQNPIFYLVMLAGAWSTFQRFYHPQDIPKNYYNITKQQRVLLTGGYFGLIAALVTAMAVNGRYKKTPEELERERRYRQIYREY